MTGSNATQSMPLCLLTLIGNNTNSVIPPFNKQANKNNWQQTSMQKATFCIVKSYVLERERPPFNS